MYELIQHQRLTSTAANITFTNIPQTWTDLLVVCSLRGMGSVNIGINGSSSNFSFRRLYAVPSVGSDSASNNYAGHLSVPNSYTANTFSNSQIYIPNYTSTTSAKSISIDYTTENNSSDWLGGVMTSLWSPATQAAIYEFQLQGTDGLSFQAGSSATLYGINRRTAIGRSPQAMGGYINYANGYWYHVFTGSGNFIPFNNMQVEYVVVAGGGGGGANGSQAGGGGAGGYRSSVVGELSGASSAAESMLSLTAGTNYSVVVGAGGIGGNWGNAMPTNGSNSSFGSVIATGGGYGGTVGPGVTWYQASAGGSSGGAGPVAGDSPSPSVANQGFVGGNYVGTNSSGGGGGGASETGNADAISAGGDGLQSTITGSPVFRAGGGAGGNSNNNGVGGDGGGGNTGVAGVANTGGGGGAGTSGNNNGMAGGSGIVIVRYRA